MPTQRKRKQIGKSIITIISLITFNYVVLYADKFQVKLDNIPIKANFVDTDIDEKDFLSVRLDNVIIDNSRNDGNITYVIKPGDTLVSIAQDVGTTVSNIRMVNGLAGDVDVKKNGTIVNKEGIALHRLTISQLPGIVVVLDMTTSVREFAAEYKLQEEDIKSLNNIADSRTILRAGDELFLTISEQDAIARGILEAPLDEKEPEQDNVVLATKPTAPVEQKKVAVASKPQTKTEPKKPTSSGKPKAKIIRSEQNGVIGYDEGTILSSWFQKDSGFAGFAAGHCTSYAASRRRDIFVGGNSFRGNAGAWYSNAKKAGNAVGKTPKQGAIVVFSPGRGASGYGHVGIVEEVDTKNGKIIISDMNYKGRNIVTKRVVDIDLPMGYIY